MYDTVNLSLVITN